MAQLPLPLPQGGGHGFEAFLPLADAAVVARLRQFAGAPGDAGILLVGAADSGKSHLALACCDHAAQGGHDLAYLPLGRVDAAMLDAVPAQALVVVDEADRAAANARLAEALFRLLNRQHDRRGAVLVCGRELPGDPARLLPDLVSRLAQMEKLTLACHDDAARRAILLHRARRQGIPLDPAAADYLLRHHDRRLGVLIDCLSQLDRESLARGRRVTPALVREWLAAQE